MKKVREYDMMVVGELNIDLILDQLFTLPQFGKEQRAKEMKLTLGSSTAIYASNCANLGSEVAFCGKIGSDYFGKFVLDSLVARGVNTNYIIVDKNLKTGATIIFNHENDRMMVTYPGVMEKMTVGEVPAELFRNSRHLHTSSIFFQPGIKSNLISLFKKAKKYGLTTSMDTQWDPEEKWELDLDNLLPELDFFLPNEQELLHLTATDSIDAALQKLSGFDTCIVVKRGTKGAVMKFNGKKYTVPAYNVPGFVDAIGAGDSFNAGFIHEFLNGKNLDECLVTGSLVAAVSTTEAGGTEAIKSFQKVIEIGNSFEFLTS